jgi:hypothetical protein
MFALWLYLEYSAWSDRRRRRRRPPAGWALPEDGCIVHGTAGCDCPSVLIPRAA